jgi:hypothetical protein
VCTCAIRLKKQNLIIAFVTLLPENEKSTSSARLIFFTLSTPATDTMLLEKNIDKVLSAAKLPLAVDI